jgi:hypothetical protein
MKCEVVLNPFVKLNNLDIQDSDPVFVNVKGYNRLYANVFVGANPDPPRITDPTKPKESYVIKNSVDDGKNVKCFEQITLNLSEKFGSSNPPNKLISFKTEYTSTGCSINDTNVVVLDPIEPNLRRFDVQLYDKNYNIIPRSDINVFSMILCIYSRRKKATMY